MPSNPGEKAPAIWFPRWIRAFKDIYQIWGPWYFLKTPTYFEGLQSPQNACLSFPKVLQHLWKPSSLISSLVSISSSYGTLPKGRRVQLGIWALLDQINLIVQLINQFNLSHLQSPWWAPSYFELCSSLQGPSFSSSAEVDWSFNISCCLQPWSWPLNCDLCF